MSEAEAKKAAKSGDSQEIKEFVNREDLVNSNVPKISIASIEPEQGPISGETRVLVRGGPFKMWEFKFPHPKCKFGEVVVDATYVTCSEHKTRYDMKEARHKDRQFRCLQCDNSPAVVSNKQVSVEVSVIGDFTDSVDEARFSYYEPTRIYAFYPRYGPKDGDTPV